MAKKKLFMGRVQGNFEICLQVRSTSENNAMARLRLIIGGGMPVFKHKLRGKGEWIHLHFDETYDDIEITEIKERG